MTSIDKKDVLEIAPYDEEQYRQAMGRVLASAAAPEIVAGYFPAWDFGSFCQYAQSARSILEFQQKLVAPAIDAMLVQTTDGMTVSGIENISKTGSYLFISNHRDILLDSALFIQYLIKNHYRAPCICLGDNLLKSPLVKDLVKMNRGVTVKRQLSPRDLMKWSFVLSTLIADERTQSKSVWIAQREGRTKNGHDETQSAVIKMLALSASENWVEHLKFLRIVPVTVSYEWEPCDLFKARERYLTEKGGNYRKADDEDVVSMMEGIKSNKGRIHIEVGTELNESLEPLKKIGPRNILMKEVSALIDRQIQSMYTRWPSNYIAQDLLTNGRQFAHRYSEPQKLFFEQRLRAKLMGTTESDRPGIREYFLKLYARPVI
jgi:1-acyl-sn-glycerol-3-phosphate acyltransferase